jgi:hypothetical protein
LAVGAAAVLAFDLAVLVFFVFADFDSVSAGSADAAVAEDKDLSFVGSTAVSALRLERRVDMYDDERKHHYSTRKTTATEKPICHCQITQATERHEI